MGWVRALATLCAFAAAAVPASAAAGPAPPSFYGVVTQSRLDRADLARMASGEVGTLRVAVPWAQIDPTPVPEDFNWRELDDTVAHAAREGVELLPTVFTVPRWVSLLEGCNGPAEGPCAITPPHTTLGLAAWRDFLAAAARRYGPGGMFWALHPEVPVRPIRTWQIWNEQNSPGFFQPRPDADRYAELVIAASEALRGQDPGAEIVLGGLFRYPLGGRNGGLRATDFMRSLYAHPGVEHHFDGVAIHPYAGRMSGVKRQVRRLIGVVRESGDRQASFWITEVGWSSGGKSTPLNRGLDGQARRLTQSFRWFTRERARLGLRAVLWYAWRDVPEAASRCKWCARSGLFPVGSLNTPKPAWASFVRFTGGS
jgi:hypothetical protein